MAKYKVKRDSYNFKVTDGVFDVAGASNAKGEASLQLIQMDGLDAACGLTAIPVIGDYFTSIDGFNAGTPTTCYTSILLDSISEEFYQTNEDCRIWTLEYTSDRNVETLWVNFNADFQVMSVDNPVLWKNAEAILPVGSNELPTGACNITDSLNQRFVKKVLQGSVDLQKKVHPDKVNDFWDDYKAVAGKLNTRALYVVGESDSNAIVLNRGQALVGSISNGELTGGSYDFSVNFAFRIINEHDASGICICRDDLNYQYTNSEVNGSGWTVPVRTDGTDATTLVGKPFTYDYSGLTAGGGDPDKIDLLIFTDYSQPDP